MGYIDRHRMKIARETSQAMQRAKVGLIGLAAVILLIGAASMIMRAVSRERPVATAGVAQSGAVPTTVLANSSEPLADLGVTASTGNTADPAASPVR